MSRWLMLIKFSCLLKVKALHYFQGGKPCFREFKRGQCQISYKYTISKPHFKNTKQKILLILLKTLQNSVFHILPWPGSLHLTSIIALRLLRLSSFFLLQVNSQHVIVVLFGDFCWCSQINATCPISETKNPTTLWDLRNLF